MINYDSSKIERGIKGERGIYKFEIGVHPLVNKACQKGGGPRIFWRCEDSLSDGPFPVPSDLRKFCLLMGTVD